MFSYLFGKKTVRKTRSAPRSSRFRPQCEVLEDRLVMTTLASPKIALVNTVILPPVMTTIASPKIALVNTVSLPPAQAVNLVTEPRDLVTGQLTNASNAQFYSFQLQKGEFLQADVMTPAGSTLGSLMTVYDSSGAVLKRVGASPSPTTGLMTNNPAYGFVAPASGTYEVQVAGNTASAVHTGAYTLELHRIALAQGTQNLAHLAQTGSMYAWLNGNTLNISGPTGYGFGLTGHWAQTIVAGSNGLVSSTYIATGDVQVQTAAGPLDLNCSSFTVNTAAQINGQVFGIISGLNATATIHTSSLLSSIGSYGFDLSSLNANATFNMKLGGAGGIGLGNSTVVHNTGAPVNKAVPYLYFTVNVPAIGNLLSFVCDPADPALYIEGSVLGAIPMGTFKLNGLGFSPHGQIPYKPVDAPTQSTSTMNGGHLVIQGTFDTTELTLIPSQVVGDVTLNLDPNHTGKFFGGATVSAAEVAGIFALAGTGGGASLLAALGAANSPLAANFDQVYRNLSVGINGTLNINPLGNLKSDLGWQVGNEILALPFNPSSFADKLLYWVNGQAFDPQGLGMLPIGHASLLYDGPTESLYFRGGTTDPFANTPLASLTKAFASASTGYSIATQAGIVPTFDLDCAIKPGGKFFLNVAGTYNIAGLPESGQILLAHNYPVTGPAARFLAPPSSTGAIGLPISKSAASLTTPLCTGIYFDAKVHVLNNYVDLQGKMYGNGDFTIQASAAINIGTLTGSAIFTMSNTQAHGFSFTGELDANFTSNYIRGGVHGDFTFGIANHSLTYAGSLHAWGQVYIPYVGWEGADLSGGFTAHEIWAAVDGYRVDFRF
jgi:hypothetical protein